MEQVDQFEGITNIKHMGNYSILKENNILSRGIKEIICIEDIIKCEMNFIKQKFEDYKEIIDYEARNAFSKVVLISTLKYIYGFNHHGD